MICRSDVIFDYIKNENELLDKITNAKIEKLYKEEIERLQNIIKEVREYIEKTYEDYKNEDGSLPLTLHDQELLEILDKADNSAL